MPDLPSRVVRAITLDTPDQMVIELQLASYNLGCESTRIIRSFGVNDLGSRRKSPLPFLPEWVSAVSMLEQSTDEELVRIICEASEAEAEESREILFRRFYPKVLSWCRRFSGDRQDAADLAQEVFLRVHQKLHLFKGKSRFSTWLYTVTRRAAINRGIASRRRATLSLEAEEIREPVDPARNVDEEIVAGQLAAKLRSAMAQDLDPLEAKVLYLHHVDGMTLPAITDLLGLDNKSGAKAYIVAGRRKLDRRFGRWLKRQSRTTAM